MQPLEQLKIWGERNNIRIFSGPDGCNAAGLAYDGINLAIKEKDDVVFDCGANSGDLFLRLSKLIDSNNYYAFEPNPLDFKVLNFNLYQLSITTTRSNAKVSATI